MLDALIVVDEYDSRELKQELVKGCLALGLKTQTISPNFFKKFILENKYRLTKPFLMFTDVSIRFSTPLREILNFHREHKELPLILSSNGEIISININSIDINMLNADTNGEIFASNGYNYVLTHKASRLLPKVDPVNIIIIAHNRANYLELSLNSLMFSLGNRTSEVPIYIVLSDPTPEVELVSKKFLDKYPHVKAVKFTPNTYLATAQFALSLLREDLCNKNIMLYEDDFILPSSVSSLYPDWPWWFSHRLQYFDLVCWSPSIDNIPIHYYNKIPSDKVAVDRNHFFANKWINSNNNYEIFTCGNAVSCSYDYYMMCSTKNVTTDNDLFKLKQGLSSPRIFGYHIGWNQEQDGYPSLGSKRWGGIPKNILATDLRTNMSFSVGAS